MLRANKRLAAARTLPLLMRFTDDGGDRVAPRDSPGRVRVKDLPESMRPKAIGAEFTPFPLPKYDESLGFGPLHLDNVPDVMKAKELHAQRQSLQSARAPTQLLQETEVDDAVAQDSLFSLLAGDDGASQMQAAACEPAEQRLNDTTAARADYEVVAGYPLIDRLQCYRSLGDLIRQFHNRPTIEARAAALADIASTLRMRTNAELTEMLYELSSIFTVGGRGLNFLCARVVKYGRPYWSTNALFAAFIHFIDSLTVALVEDEPHRLAESPELMIQVLHFFALIRIFEPNKWFSHSDLSVSNRADYSHPRGTNLLTAHKNTGAQLYDFIIELVVNSTVRKAAAPHLDSRAENHAIDAERAFFEERGDPQADDGVSVVTEGRFTLGQLVDLLKGFVAVIPDGQVPGGVLRPIVKQFMRQVAESASATEGDSHPSSSTRWVKDEKVLQAMESMYFTLSACDFKEAPILRDVLLGRCRYMQVDPNRCCGPNFFAALSRDPDSSLKESVGLDRLECALRQSACVAHGPERDAEAHGTPLQPRESEMHAALVEAGSELLMSLRNKELAVAFAQKHNFDSILLETVPSFGGIAARLEQEEGSRLERTLPVSDLLGVQERLNLSHKKASPPLVAGTRALAIAGAPTSTLLAKLSRRGEAQRTSRVGEQLPHGPSSQRRRKKKSIPTFLSQLPLVNSVNTLFLLHSSFVTSNVDQLISLVRRLSSGVDGVIVTQSCLKALAAQARSSSRERGRSCAKQALDILSYETEKGRVFLVPLSEELALHDAGAFADEDVMLWTLAAYLARELPLVKVHTLIHSGNEALAPSRFLRGPNHLLAVSRTIQTNHHSTSYCGAAQQGEPLLRSLYHLGVKSITRNATLQMPVRDRPLRLYNYNPVRARFIYRRDRALFDRVYTPARNLAPGFASGSLAHDFRSLGVYTPDHAQPAYAPFALPGK